MKNTALAACLALCATLATALSGCISAEGNYRRGESSARRGDNKEAFDYFKQAAEQGNAKAQTELGAMYWGNVGTSKNASEAVRWWERAAASGDCDAQGLLGNAYDNGEEGVPSDTNAAIRWYSAAAEQGNTLAM